MTEIIFDYSNVDDRDDESDLCLSVVTWTGPTAHTSTASLSGCFGTCGHSGHHHLYDHERSQRISGCDRSGQHHLYDQRSQRISGRIRSWFN